MDRVGTATGARTRRLRRLAASAAAGPLAAAVLLLGTAGPASAHARLVSSEPAANATVRSAPRSLSITFDEAVQRSFALVAVVGPGGGRLDTGAPRISGATVTQQVAPLPGAGDYTMSFRVVSDDGHPVQGSVHFRFAPPAGYRAAPSSPQPVNLVRSTPRAAGGWASTHGTTLLLVVVVVLVLAAAATLTLGRRRGQA